MVMKSFTDMKGFKSGGKKGIFLEECHGGGRGGGGEKEGRCCCLRTADALIL